MRTTAQRPGAAAGVVREPVGARIKDGLVLEPPTFVDVDEGLMSRVVWKEYRVDVEKAGRVAFDVENEAQALTFGEYLDCTPAQRGRLGVEGDV